MAHFVSVCASMKSVWQESIISFKYDFLIIEILLFFPEV